MTQSELKQKLYDLVSEYFRSAAVIWGKVKTVNPSVPLIVLNFGAVNRHYLPLTQNVNGVLVNGYPSRTTLQIDLYTKGAAINTSPGVTAAYENTAVNDLTDFLNFINSAFVDDWSELNDISISGKSVNDLTELINGTTWDYRAMIELEIGFTQTAVGHTGTMHESGVPFHRNGCPKYNEEGYALDETGTQILDEDENPIQLPLDDEGKPIMPEVIITPSGGRTQVLANLYTGWFERVDGPELEHEEE